MTKRTRLFLVVTVGVLVLGLGTGLLASYVGVQNFSIIGSNGPEELAYVPADARMIAFADVRSVVASELREKLRQFEPTADEKNQFETQTGIDIERDIDTVLVAASPQSLNGPPLALARGRFDMVRIEGLIRQNNGTVEDYKGKRLLITTEGPGMAVASVEPGLVAAGTVAAVKRAIDTKAAGVGSITGNADVLKLIKDADDGNAWAVAKLDAISTGPLPQEILQRLPAINWFSATGRVDSGIEAVLRAEARDEKSAQDLRDVIRGFMALARMQAGTNPQFAEVVNSLELGGQDNMVVLRFAVPAPVIDAVAAIASQRRRPAADAPVAPENTLPAPSPAVPSL